MAIATRGEGNVAHIFADTVLSSAASSYCTAQDFTGWNYFGIYYQATPTTAVSGVRLWYEMSYSPTTGFIIPDGKSDIDASLDDVDAHLVSVAPPPMMYFRVGATVISGEDVPADTTLNAWLFVQ